MTRIEPLGINTAFRCFPLLPVRWNDCLRFLQFWNDSFPMAYNDSFYLPLRLLERHLFGDLERLTPSQSVLSGSRSISRSRAETCCPIPPLPPPVFSLDFTLSVCNGTTCSGRPGPEFPGTAASHVQRCIRNRTTCSRSLEVKDWFLEGCSPGPTCSRQLWDVLLPGGLKIMCPAE